MTAHKGAGRSGPAKRKEGEAVADTSGEEPTPRDTYKDEEVPVTEKPVPTEAKTSEYVVTVDDSSGAVVKIEEVSEKSGERREFSGRE